ncbi:recombinase family protein [Microbacterium saperdae]|uniref:recombinase family protein n=1 Tax=Microbacterium saperdae TaxID=69368 RepID=UPI001152025D
MDELSFRGLTTHPTVSRPPGQVSTSKMSRLLREPYYIGQITYQGEVFDGRHPALIDRDLFDQVQSMLEQSGRAGERRRIYEQYLKGSVFCGECQLERGVPNNRLVIQRAVGRNKVEYFYFFCIGRHHGHCDSRHIPVHEVEEAVTAHYRTVQLDAGFIEWVERAIDNVLSDRQAVQAQLRSQLKARLQQLSVKADNLVDLVAEGAASPPPMWLPASARYTSRSVGSRSSLGASKTT